MQLKETLGADGCNLFLEREIRCEKHTKHPYHIRGLNNVCFKCQTQVIVAEKICDAVSGASTHQLSFFGIKLQPLADRGNALFQSVDWRNYVADVAVNVWLVVVSKCLQLHVKLRGEGS